VTIRYDPRDLAEIRVYLGDAFLCRAVCQELAGQTVSLKDIVRARNARRREVRAGLSARAQIVETLLGSSPALPTAESTPPAPTVAPTLKRYWNE